MRWISSGACTLFLLGTMGYLIYIGVTGKVNWAIIGGLIGTAIKSKNFSHY